MLHAILKYVKRMAGGLKEKPQPILEDFVLEHFLLYHGLVGTQQENNRQFKDVRADIIDAVNKKSSFELSIALRVPPLWWQDKLQTICAELDQQQQNNMIACLLPAAESSYDGVDNQPLKNSDWRVRANAAYVLSFFKVQAAVPQLIEILQDAADDVNPAFCHIAFALGQLGGKQALEPLYKYLDHEEAWFRVDAANAISMWPLEETMHRLMPAVLNPHNYSDYMSVCIAKHYDVAHIVNNENHSIQSGALELINGVLDASEKTFSLEIIEDTQIASAFSGAYDLCKAQPSPRKIFTCLHIHQWLNRHRQMLEDHPRLEFDAAKINFDPASIIDVKHNIADWIKNHSSEKINSNSELRHAIILAGQYKINEALPYLITLIAPDFIFLNELLECLGNSGDSKCAAPIVELVGQIVDLQERTEQTLSKQPIFENNPKAAQSYWQALKALGNLPDEQALQLLTKSANDSAQDKRLQAISSLKTALTLSDKSLQQKFLPQLEEIISSRLKDPSAEVRVETLDAVLVFSLAKFIPQVFEQAGSKEVSLFKKAKAVLLHFYQSGHSAEIDKLLAQNTLVMDQLKRERFGELAASLPINK